MANDVAIFVGELDDAGFGQWVVFDLGGRFVGENECFLRVPTGRVYIG